MKKRGPKHNGVELDAKGNPISKYARKKFGDKKPYTYADAAKDFFAGKSIPINGQHIGNVSDD